MRILRKGKARGSNILLFLLLFAIPQPARADFPGNVAIGIGLQQLGEALKAAVDKAIAGGLILEVQAGGQIATLIGQTETAFRNQKDLLLHQLSGTQQATLNSVWTIEKDFENKAYKDISEITNRAQQTANTIPGANHLPQIASFGPTWVVGSSSLPISYRIGGNFFDVVRKGYDPIAIVNPGPHQIQAKLTQKGTTLLTFDLPASALGGAETLVTAHQLSLDIPYRERRWLFFHRKQHSAALMPLMVLPTRLGDLAVTSSTASTKPVTQTNISPENHQDSEGEDIKCGGEHGDQAIHTWPPTYGWRVVPGSVTMDIVWSQGENGPGKDWWLERNCSTDAVACVCVSTEHHAMGTSGKVIFKIHFTETKDSVVTTPSTDTLRVGWGERRVKVLPVGSLWTASLLRFDGKHFDYATPATDDFLSIGQTSNILTITSAPFTRLSEPELRKAWSKSNPSNK